MPVIKPNELPPNMVETAINIASIGKVDKDPVVLELDRCIWRSLTNDDGSR